MPPDNKNAVIYAKIAQFINIFLFALVAGVFWGTWFSLSRSIASITSETFLEVGRTMIQNPQVADEHSCARRDTLNPPGAVLVVSPETGESPLHFREEGEGVAQRSVHRRSHCAPSPSHDARASRAE